MILCSCNVISDRDVHAAAKPCGAPAERPSEVFRCLGHAPKCGKCIRSIRAALDTACGGGATRASEPLSLEACA
jgi:bacterioferritin-associated ferredoxin